MGHVLIIGDTHYPGLRQGYVDFLQHVADSHDVTRIVHIGDLDDWPDKRLAYELGELPEPLPSNDPHSQCDVTDLDEIPFWCRELVMEPVLNLKSGHALEVTEIGRQEQSIFR